MKMTGESNKDYSFLKILFIYSGETQAPCREPDVGLDPGSPGSGPVLKAALNH